MISSFCKTDEGMCIDVTRKTGDDGVRIRNTTDAVRQVFATREEWEAFIAGVKAGEFDHLAEPVEAAATV